MTSVRLGLAALPLVTFLLTLYAVRPVASTPGPIRPGSIRLGVARAAVMTGAFGIACVEVLSALRWLGAAGMIGAWTVALAASGVAAAVRRRRDRDGDAVFRFDLRARIRSWTPGERLAAFAVLGLVAAELVLALASPPNNYDSQTYHLPRVEHWARSGSVDLFATGIHRQVTYPPGAEFLLLHLRLLTGSDALYNLLQWSAGVLCLVLVTRIAAQLGVPRRGQVLAALVVASVPMVVLQSSSTQTDLVVAAWVACAATLVLDGVGSPAPRERSERRQPGPVPPRRPDLSTVLLIGAAAGLVTVTKATGGLFVGPLLVWWTLAQVRRGRPTAAAGRAAVAGATGRVAAAALAVVVVALLLAGPQFVRVYEAFGGPLGPPELSRSLTLERRDPGSVLINALRVAHTALEVPVPPVNRWTAKRIIDLAGFLGRDPSDPRTTFYQQQFPNESWYPHEDKAALPLHALLLLIGGVAAVIRGGRAGGDRRLLVYAGSLAVAVVAYVAIFKWQPWGNRLLLFLVVPAGPLAGAWLDGVLDRAAGASGRTVTRRAARAARFVVTGALVVAVLAGTLAVAYGYPRRLLGKDSALTRDDMAGRFAIRPGWLPSYESAAREVNATGARRVGLVTAHDSWNYPWYLLLTASDLRSLQSPAPAKLPPATAADVDAIVCAAPTWMCRPLVPLTWTYKHDGTVGWAFPPPRS